MSAELSKDERERQLDAKIAALRAKEAAKKQRHKEVERDRELAEKQNQSITTAPRVVRGEAGPGEPEPGSRALQRLGRGRESGPRQTGETRREQGGRGGGRLGEGQGPPPDPGYRFLADRMREGSDGEEEEEEGRGPPRRRETESWARGGRGRGRGRGGGAPWDQPGPEPWEGGNGFMSEPRGGMRGRGGPGRGRGGLSRPFPLREGRRGEPGPDWGGPPGPRTEKVSPRGPSRRDWSEAGDWEGGPPPSAPAPAKPPAFSNGKHTAGAGERAGFAQHSAQYSAPFPPPEPQQQQPASNWKCPDPGCRQLNGPSAASCTKCGIAYKDANDYISNYACEKVKQEYNAKKVAHSKVEPGRQTEETTVTQPGPAANPAATNGFQPSPSIPQPMLQQPAQQGIKDWTVEVEQGGWSGPAGQVVLGTSGQHTAITTSVESWAGLADQQVVMSTMLAPQPAMQYGLMMNPVPVPSYPPPFYPPAPVPSYYGSAGPEFYTAGEFGPGYQQAGGLTVFNPTAQVFVPPGPEPGPPHLYKAPPPFPGPATAPTPRPAKPAVQADPALLLPLNRPPAPVALRRPGGRGGQQGRASQDRDWRQAEQGGPAPASRLPPRFQRQREPQASPAPAVAKPPSMIEMQSGSLKRGVGLGAPPPGAGTGLLVVGPQQLLHYLNTATMAGQLGLPVDCLAGAGLEELEQQVARLKPDQHWLVLVHGLAQDARTIASTRRSDADKAAEADNVANQFCDLVEQRLLGAAPHICVLVSMLLPRVDMQEHPGMANPNNVRKVINVQITSRLYENPRVTLINSDQILEWGDDNTKLNEMMSPDGHQLTGRGCQLVLANWLDHLRKKLKSSNFVPAAAHPVVGSAANPEPVAVVTSQDTPDLPPDSDSEEKEDEEDGDTVPDPFGSYEAPVVVVSPKVRTVSQSEPGQTEDGQEVDDDALPNLEIVLPSSPLSTNSSNPQQTITFQQVGATLSSLSLSESLKETKESVVTNGVENKAAKAATDDEDEEFHDVEDGGFIEDSYCGGGEKPEQLPSLVTLQQDDPGPVSGHFMEDSYLPSSPGLEAMSGNIQWPARE